ncbi:MAG: hypothetical protein LBP26_04620 [Clostridiales bacterium]|jgi:hypothetical protein|nr:hypothetical protein [Clostridiales bacterium]
MTDARYKFHAMAHHLTTLDDPEPVVDGLIEKGVAGVVINHPFGEGYLRDPVGWERLNRLVAMLKKKGVIVWIYDEDAFPSGTARDLVLKESPDYGTLGITLFKTDARSADEWQKPDDVLDILFSYPVGGKLYIVCAIKLFEGTAAAANYGRPYINIADKKAVDAFIRITYDAYAEKLENLSRDVDAFFTDEPALMEAYIDVEREYKDGHKYTPVSWVRGLEKRFLQMHGYDLTNKLHFLFEGDSVEARVTRVNYRQTLAAAVSESYFQNIADWCAARGVKSSGHIDNEEFIHDHVAYYGNLYTTLDKAGYIGCDCLRATLSRYMEYWYMGTKHIGSLARIRGKSDLVMIELCSLERHLGEEDRVVDEQVRAVCNMMWLAGINYLNSYWPIERFKNPVAFSDYLGRMGSTLHGAVHDAQIGVYYPVETFQALYKPIKTANHATYRRRETEIGALEEDLRSLATALWSDKRDFDFIDAVAIEGAAVTDDGFLQISGMKIGTVIMAGAEVVPVGVLEKLERLRAAGGTVIWSGRKPLHGARLTDTERIARYARTVTLSADPVADIAAASGGPRWSGDGDFIVSAFIKDGAPLYMFVNNNGRDIRIGKTCGGGGGGYELLDPSEDGAVELQKPEFTVKAYSAVFLTERAGKHSPAKFSQKKG